MRKTPNMGHRRAGFRLGGLPALKIAMGSAHSKIGTGAWGGGAIPLGQRTYGGDMKQVKAGTIRSVARSA